MAICTSGPQIAFIGFALSTLPLESLLATDVLLAIALPILSTLTARKSSCWVLGHTEHSLVHHQLHSQLEQWIPLHQEVLLVPSGVTCTIEANKTIGNQSSRQ
eukprot:6490969-Amphidinium_carterae.1